MSQEINNDDELNTSNKYKLNRKLGEGSFGQIFHGVNVYTNQEVAIKLERVNCQHPQLFYESKVLKYINDQQNKLFEQSQQTNRHYLSQNTSHRQIQRSNQSQNLNLQNNNVSFEFPQIFSACHEGEYNVMVMELLGPNLNDLFNLFNRQFSMKTTIMISIQLVSLLERLHSFRFVHRDIKLSNICIGCGKRQNVLYLMDFGLAKKYVDRDGKHIGSREGKGFVGNIKYASINQHMGIETSRRDDLESACYIMICLMKKELPWFKIPYNKNQMNKDEYNEKVLKSKTKTSIEVLTSNVPKEVTQILKYCRSLQFEQEPDYDKIKIVLQELLMKQGQQVDQMYDWNNYVRSQGA